MKLNTAFKRNNEDNLMKRKITKILLLTRLFTNKNKVTKEERNVNRDKRNELQLIIERSRAIGFDYILRREKSAKLCFGSTLPRKVLPRESKYMSPLMRRKITNMKKCPDPGAYKLEGSMIKKYPNKSGYTLLASKVPRLQASDANATPAVGTYDLEKNKLVKPSKIPFGRKGAYRQTAMLGPGPGSYNFFRKINTVEDSFGGKRHLVPAVRIICSPVNRACCKLCSEVPEGDYWRDFTANEDLCRPCMKLQWDELKKSSSVEVVARVRKTARLEQFKRARYCDFYHKHGGTRAALPILSLNVLRKKLNQENYLSKYGM